MLNLMAMRRVLRRLFTDSALFRWQNQTLRGDLVLAIPVAACLAIGIAVGHPAAGMIAAGGAVNTGFGEKKSIEHSRLLPMIFVTFGMAFAGFLGVLLGHENLVLVFVSALVAFAYGLLTGWPAGYGWVAQQCVITFLVASAFPASLSAAADRGLLLFAGGAIQLVFASAVLHLFRNLDRRFFEISRLIRDEEQALRLAIVNSRQSFLQPRFVNPALPYALRLAVTIGVSTEIYRRLHYPSGYWIPMTALLVLKPGLTDTVSRAIARMIGTMSGAIVVSFCLAHMHTTPIVLAGFTVLSAWLAYGLLNVNYALFSMAVTSYIVFLLSLNAVPGHTLAVRRTFCTLLGAGIALLVRIAVVFLRRRRSGIHVVPRSQGDGSFDHQKGEPNSHSGREASQPFLDPSIKTSEKGCSQLN